MKLAVLTGEPSGDLIAEAAVRALRERHPDLELLGVGGEGLARAGLESRFRLSEFAVNGVVEVLPHLLLHLSVCFRLDRILVEVLGSRLHFAAWLE